MKDNNFEDQENIDFNDEELKGDNTNDKDYKVCKEESEKVFSQEAKADSAEEKSGEEEGKDSVQEKQKAEEDNEECGVNSESCGKSEYVPDFIVMGNVTEEEKTASANRNQKKTVGIGAVIAICAVCVALSVTFGALAGAIAAGGVQLDLSGAAQGEVVKMVRSNRDIDIEELLGETGQSNMTVAQVAAYIGENVVEITTTHVETNQIYGQYITSGAGSGVVFDQNTQTGYTYIVTNYHVISGADKISVRIKHDSQYNDYEAEYIGGDSAEDIAVIGVAGVEQVFRELVFAQSDKVVVGEQVVAIGNPLGKLGGTVTDGIISALDREIIIGDNTMRLLQTNAAINPGNSGGGLFNMSGELVGIVNAKQSSEGIEGLGFAIPSDIVYKDICDIIEYGYVRGRITLGITVQYGTYKGVTGVFVTDAGNTKFALYDRIVGINDVSIESVSDYNSALKNLSAGASVTVRIARGGRFYNVTLTAEENKSKY